MIFKSIISEFANTYRLHCWPCIIQNSYHCCIFVPIISYREIQIILEILNRNSHIDKIYLKCLDPNQNMRYNSFALSVRSLFFSCSRKLEHFQLMILEIMKQSWSICL